MRQHAADTPLELRIARLIRYMAKLDRWIYEANQSAPCSKLQTPDPSTRERINRPVWRHPTYVSKIAMAPFLVTGRVSERP